MQRQRRGGRLLTVLIFGVMLAAEILAAEVLAAEVLPTEILAAEVFSAEVLAPEVLSIQGVSSGVSAASELLKSGSLSEWVGGIQVCDEEPVVRSVEQLRCGVLRPVEADVLHSIDIIENQISVPVDRGCASRGWRGVIALVPSTRTQPPPLTRSSSSASLSSVPLQCFFAPVVCND